MTTLSDNTVTGQGDVDGYNPAPLTLYYIITDFGRANTHDISSSGRWFDIGWVAPYFHVDPTGSDDAHYQFDPIFLPFAHGVIGWHQYAGGLDGFHYELGDGVEVRFFLTDD